MSGGQSLNNNESVAVSLLTGILGGAEVLGIDVQGIIKSNNLEALLKAPGTGRIEVEDFFSCLRLIESEARDEAIGLRLGAELAVSNFNALGYAAASCETLNDALLLIPKYEPLIMTQGKTQIYRHNGLVKVSWTLTGGEYLAILENIFLACWVTLGRLLSGNQGLAIKASFTYKKAANLAAWYKVFGVDCLFDQEVAAIEVDEALLDLAILQPDPFMFEVMTKQANDLYSALADQPLESQVASWLITQLPQGEPEQIDLARFLNLSERTLRRRLQQDNTTYKQILENVRQERATYYLQQTSLPILQISLQLGYSQLTSFNAAYKRWTGLTPGAVRSKR